MQPFQCDLQPQIPKHPITTHTQAHPKQLEATVTVQQEKKANRPQPHPPRRRSTFHRRLQPLYTEKHKVSCSGFLHKTKPMQHSCSHSTAICHHRFKKHIELRTQLQERRHHFPSSTLPFVTTSLCHHFPSSPLPFLTTSHRHHLPSSPPCFIASYSM